ncbi:hypothetical protein SAMN05421766_11167 [Zobellia uliginosa]|uniref:Uncharacterized protein n=1 Tax=Zobellia uliginosa TaxID=143224 RepID=A0ABY1L1T6_9FLAO|nr:hypothetical protein [Zobellia uliginosa]SIT12284.1 hypothetical protein SAMN05421766_11167 [Zobellia uliginosa]
MQNITMKLSQKIALIIVITYCIFHVLVLFQIIPYDVVWGGKIKSVNEMYILEGVALTIMLFIGAILSMKSRLVKPFFAYKTIKRILLVFAIVFMLNTIGNLLAKTIIEKSQAIITLYLAVVLYKSSKK